MQAALEAFASHRPCGQNLNAVVDCLTTLAHDTRPNLDEVSLRVAREKLLASLAIRYTMASERTAHAHTLGLLPITLSFQANAPDDPLAVILF